jgi:hypothetical protein
MRDVVGAFGSFSPSAFVTGAAVVSCSHPVVGHWVRQEAASLEARIAGCRDPIRLAAGHSARRRSQHLPIQDDHICNWLIDVSNDVAHLLNVLH